MNITNIERNWRLFAEPIMVFAGGLLGMVVISQAIGKVPMLAEAGRLLDLMAAGVAFTGLLWMAWRVWLLWRWENGDLNGGCHSCAGVMAHHTGRYGAYSKCLMCGSKQEGHH